IPVVLNIPDELVDDLAGGDFLALRDGEGVMIAALKVDECYQRDLEAEIEAIFGTADRSHTGVAQYLHRTRQWAVAGRVEALQLPVHYDYPELRRTPAETRELFVDLGWRKVLTFQTHRTIHRAQQAMMVEAARDAGANILIHPVVGLDQPGDADHYTRIRCYRAVLPQFTEIAAHLNLLPLAMRGGDGREALLHAIVNKNYGSTHLMVDFDGSGTVLDTVGKPAYKQEEATQIINEHAADLGVEMVATREMAYLEDRKQFAASNEIPEGNQVLRLTGDEVRQRLDAGREIPAWYTFGEVARELEHRYPARGAQGFTVFLTGLSGSGKSTIANVLRVKLLELGGRGVTLLDGDLVRANLSSELGFSKEHRDLNIRRIGFVASEITRAGGVAICAPIAPYDVVRREVREMVQPCGGFVLVHVATPLEVCEARDRKGMYAKARAGIIKEFTGISDPYEVPEDADVVIDTSNLAPAAAADAVPLYLERQGYISASDVG
ncbi:MAG: bifunctional sulfate adenylyltransferase/adenylylsulfate kinase, partial [Thermoanaerobaculales bacterium]|nr:bifunctional sulfate adenylyltransferase/adenylylsulfate kinase [Thermoanaerobaculales bacterium]